MSSRRIIVNTAATYVRSVIAAALALFSSRWVLTALGQSDYGLFNVVGTVIVFITFINSIMAVSVARHFAYGIGQGDPEAVNQWFNSALSIHLILPVVLTLTGWPIGEYCIAHVLTIPYDRISTCLWVFRISMVSAFFSMISIPFSAMFTAKQHIAELAVWGTLQSVLTFLFAYWLTRLSGDRLLFYAIGIVVITVCIQIGQTLRAMIVFRECRVRFSQWFDLDRLKKILSFALWNLLATTAGLLSNQGTMILLNLNFGPKVNAAYGISNVVSAQTGTLSNAMLSSFSPEIIASEGRGDRARMLDLAMRTCKFGTLLGFFFAIPLILDIDFVLKLWLHEPPLYTALFCQLMLGMFLINQLTVGYMIAVSAHGKIAGYQTILSICNITALPMAWIFLKFGFAPTSVTVALIIASVISALARIYWVRQLFALPVNRWVTNVFLPCLAVATISVFASSCSIWWLPPSFFRLVLNTAVSIIVTALASWVIALNYREREFVLQNIRSSFARFIY